MFSSCAIIKQMRQLKVPPAGKAGCCPKNSCSALLYSYPIYANCGLSVLVPKLSSFSFTYVLPPFQNCLVLPISPNCSNNQEACAYFFQNCWHALLSFKIQYNFFNIKLDKTKDISKTSWLQEITSLVNNRIFKHTHKHISLTQLPLPLGYNYIWNKQLKLVIREENLYQ